VTAAPIKYDRPVANFIAGLDATGHVTHKSYKKKSVTFHMNAGRLSLAGILDVWKTRPASAHFQSDSSGRIGQYVGVQEYAWATGNTTGNIESISIEMANSTLSPTWRVAEATWKSAARLAGWLFANVIDGRPRPSRSNVFVHKHWKATDCAGPYIDSIFPELLREVQQWYDFFRRPATPVTSTTPADWEDIMALFNSKEEFEASVAAGVEKGFGDYMARFLKDEAGSGDSILDDVKAHRQAELARLDKLVQNTTPKV
jgi:hypothetical protein